MFYCKKRGVIFILYVDDLMFLLCVFLGNGFLGGINFIFFKNIDYKFYKIRVYNLIILKKVMGVILKGIFFDVLNDICKWFNEFKMKYCRVVFNYVNNLILFSYENVIVYF